jgi:hypothetical protein
MQAQNPLHFYAISFCYLQNFDRDFICRVTASESMQFVSGRK